MSSKYEKEQAGLSEKVKTLKAEVAKENDQSMTTDMFLSTVRQYTRAKKLTPRMLNELVDFIEVYHAEKIDGVWKQRLRIHYNCIGSITIPETLLEAPSILIQTRKGVALSYTPAQIAM